MAEDIDNNEELESAVVDYRTLTDTDEHGTEWVEVEYTYECPTENYVDGPATENVTMTYRGPKYLYLWVNKRPDEPDEHGTFETVLREWEAREATNDFIEIPEEIELIKLDATVDPLGAEVLSDYHDNFKDMESYLETTGEVRTIPPVAQPPYLTFNYEYPIHPDELYDDKKTKWNFETNELDLYKNSSQDIMGVSPTWKELRQDRNERLDHTDTLWLVLKEPDPERWAKIDEYRTALKGFPDYIAENNIPLIFADSCFPYTDALDPDLIAGGDDEE